MTPNEQKALDEHYNEGYKLGLDKGYNISAKVRREFYDLGRADERRRIEKLINEAYLCCGMDSKDCPRKADLLSLINKE